MKKYAVLFLLSILLAAGRLSAQKRQIAFSARENATRINDSYREPNGDLVAVGGMSNKDRSISTTSYPLIFKATPAGDILWSYTHSYLADFEATHICKAANGDYLVLATQQAFGLSRISPDGKLRWLEMGSFSSMVNNIANSVAELSNGNIAVCGQNDFDYGPTTWLQYQGFISVFDSSGHILFSRDYGFTGSSGFDYFFQDIVCLGNKIFIAGYINDLSRSAIQGILLVLDLDGNVLTTRLLPRPLITEDSTGINNHLFTDLITRDGQLYINGKSIAPGSQHLIGRIDTGSYEFSGYALSVDSATELSNTRLFVQDSTEYYAMAGVLRFGAPNLRAYISKIKDDSLVRCKKIEKDSLIILNNIYTRDDTVFTDGWTGLINNAFSGYFMSTHAGGACDVVDTSLSLRRFSTVLDTTFDPPSGYEYMYHVSFLPWESQCLYSMYLCGDSVCPSSVYAQLDSMTSTILCYGDTVHLFADGCYPKNWYRDGVILPGDSNSRFVTQPGTYYVTVTNNACTDTSGSITVRYKFVPHISISGDTLYSTAGASYQWLDSAGNPIPGATHAYLVPPAFRTYSVAVTDSSGCTEISAPFMFPWSTGLNELSAAKYSVLEVYPNPASTTINVNNKTGQTALVILRDISGRNVRSWEQAPGLQVYSLSGLQQTDGIYWIQLIQGTVSAVQKLVVTNAGGH